MAYEKIDLETPQPNGKVGEPGPTAWAKARRMFSELYGVWNLFTNTGADALSAANVRKSLALVTQETPLDSAQGRVLLAGAGGLLGNTQIWKGNIDDQTAVPKARVYVTGATGTLPTSFGLLDTMGQAGDFHVQTWHEIVGDVSVGGRQFRRAGLNGKWGPWRLIYDDSSAVGTIASGAFAESGINANGSYTRYRDGTIMMGGLMTVQASANGYIDLNVNFPAEVLSTPPYRVSSALQPKATWEGLRAVNGVANISTSYCLIRAALNGATAQELDVRWNLIGRWK